MSIIGDVSDDDEENAEEYENYVKKQEEMEQKKQEKADNPKKTIKEKISEKRVKMKENRSKKFATI